MEIYIPLTDAVGAARAAIGASDGLLSLGDARVLNRAQVRNLTKRTQPTMPNLDQYSLLERSIGE